MITNKIFDAITIAAGGTATSVPLDLSSYAKEGYFSLHITLSGSGTAKFEYMVSNDKTNFVTQTATADVIVSGFTATSGPGSDGKDVISFEPELADQMKIICTETGAANSVTITVVIAVM